MNTNKILTTGLGLLIALTGALGVTACSSDNGAGTATQSSQAAASVDVAEDLENARLTVLEALEDDDWAQVMLASDVDAPTVKYGLLVMPYTYSEATSRVQGTIEIDGGDFTIEADSAETGKTWQIDQDGNITEVTE
ncbi:hypothetical protein BCR15_03890 [Tessaracoccus lapidicaptus]|uniref:Uncharacterized protein n=1 Tax=Tessaracoccus lapidicaptus TaxID=1427523 RepID=A0A1C0AM14_9ACTN|nr:MULTISPECIES: hypothetical protein [Tessaracoccus]AQX15421.1 hypothetical protein BKM78_05405 [Tessaracoccus sp. T2.5-30]OCL33790.1 hypothetical protein BCR15_03890 [Tessaracoccus lapidicaptus]VEP39724.1 hypothetical protein TLA_TLA_01096 [Tessaracoccus lapidicaptus]